MLRPGVSIIRGEAQQQQCKMQWCRQNYSTLTSLLPCHLHAACKVRCTQMILLQSEAHSLHTHTAVCKVCCTQMILLQPAAPSFYTSPCRLQGVLLKQIIFVAIYSTLISHIHPAVLSGQGKRREGQTSIILSCVLLSLIWHTHTHAQATMSTTRSACPSPTHHCLHHLNIFL